MKTFIVKQRTGNGKLPGHSNPPPPPPPPLPFSQEKVLIPIPYPVISHKRKKTNIKKMAQKKQKYLENIDEDLQKEVSVLRNIKRRLSDLKRGPRRLQKNHEDYYNPKIEKR